MSGTQTDRPFRVKTTLGEDVLLLDSFTGMERISAPFEYVLRVLTADPNVDMNGLLRKPVVLSLTLISGERTVHGLVSRMKLLSYGDDGMAAYEVEVAPWLWFLNLFSNCRIFQNKSVLEIVEAVFKDRGFSDYRNATSGTYPKREYCVQYRETDFNFVSRLLEEEGVFYFFEHTEEKHTLVLADRKSAFNDCKKGSAAKFMPSVGTHLEEDTVAVLEQEFRVFPGKSTLTDYDFEKPNTDLLATLANEKSPGEIYDYPGNYKLKSEGDRYARIRLEEREVANVTVRGNGNCMDFQAGYKFTLAEHYRDACNQDYTLIWVRNEGRNPRYLAGTTIPFEFHNEFEAIPNSVDYRPPRLARKPLIEGSQTAVVVGKAGEEIWTDKYGRVTVQFPWDREGKLDENSSCWIRVAHQWAGKQWGAIYTPRIGQEVIVGFLEGDPDQPIITGRVYNADLTVPYALPGEQTKSTLKSMSSKGGGGFNEFRFEDKKGEEQVFLHGEKDLDVRIKNDRKEWIGRDRNLIVKRDKMEKVERDGHVDVTRDRIEKIGRDRHLAVEGKQAIKITGSHSMDVTGNVIEEFKANHSSQVTGSLYLKGMTVVVEGATELTLKVGGNFIDINPAGVFIKGAMVFINSGGAAGSGSPGSLVPPLAATAAMEADKADPGAMATAQSKQAAKQMSLSALTLAGARKSAASDAPMHDPNSEENKQKKHWIEIELVGEDGKPIPGETYLITLPDGKTQDGTLDDKGLARVDGIDPGTCKVTFPNLDKDAWKPK
ncbi:MAG: type VI secretion system tip protein VgrG [Chthoniobacterales bacterium]|nr:MAG: type VI secretion system tip protein VgrG [Chthoniobacterales bacterium]